VDVVLNGRHSLARHPNAMTIEAFDAHGFVLHATTYYSVGGGFVVTDAGASATGAGAGAPTVGAVPYPFTTGEGLLRHAVSSGQSISGIMLANELVSHTEEHLRTRLLTVWSVMQKSVAAGCSSTEVFLPGKLNVPRRAPALFARLTRQETEGSSDPMDWLSLFALAVNEENAAGGRVVTAPTNGAAGIIPAVLHYYLRTTPGVSDDDIVRFLLTAAAIGTIFKTNASISGAEVGCQGEVGSACSMAAGALCEMMGGTPAQVENAAEIGIEHNLGLTCDPIGGLVQIPCIERNAIAAHKAIAAARLAMHGDGSHRVSLDDAVHTLRTTGADMSHKYKETSLGGLAVNVTEC
jgi:L-serine dehydratase